MSSSYLGQAFSLVVAFCWSQNSLIYSRLGKTNDADAIASVRLYLALPMLIVINLVMNSRVISPCLSLSDWAYLLGSGLLGFYITDVFQIRSYQYIGPRESVSIFTLNPCISAIMAFFFLGQKLTISQAIGMMVTAAGVIVLVYPDLEKERRGRSKDNRLKGIALATGAAFFQALSLVLARKANSEIDPYSVNLVRCIGGLVSLSVFRLANGQWSSDFRIMAKKPDGLLLLSAAFLGPALGMCLEMKAFTLASLGVVTAITQISPVILLVIDLLYCHKRPSGFSIAGTLISISGVMLLFLP